MSMPKIECANIDKCCAAASLLQSVALEETAISHILNAEGGFLKTARSLLSLPADTALAAGRFFHPQDISFLFLRMKKRACYETDSSIGVAGFELATSASLRRRSNQTEPHPVTQ